MSSDLSNFNITDLSEIDNHQMMLELNVDVENLTPWIKQNGPHVNRLLRENGAILIRSLPIHGSKKLERVLTTLFNDQLLEYNFRSTPRTKMRGRIYTSSEYHPDETISLHNENAYSNEWAMNIAFYCVKPAESGGATPIASSKNVYQSIPVEIRTKFEKKKLMYVRNYGDIDLPWSEVFQTDNRQEVESYCNHNDIQFEWIGDNGLRTRQIAGAAYFHPVTGDKIWFNQAHLFHVSSLSDKNRASLEDAFDKENLPRNVYYADGEDIEEDALTHIRQAYDKNMISFDWQEGDLMLLDNMLYSHGRKPFSGSRRILVGMASIMNSKSEQLKQLASVG